MNKTSKEYIELEKIEKNRISIEKYKTKKLILLAGIPFVVILLYFSYMIYLFVVGGFIEESIKEMLFYYIFGPSFLGFLILGNIDNWDEKIKIKRELKYSDELKYDFDYNEDYFYTDSYLVYLLYNFVKLLFFIITFVIIGFFAILLFNWLGNITIAPITIIIILLLIIIYNQNKH